MYLNFLNKLLLFLCCFILLCSCPVNMFILTLCMADGRWGRWGGGGGGGGGLSL